MKLFIYSLEGYVRLWYKTIPCGSISSLKSFHIAFNHFFKILCPSDALFEEFCGHFNVENIFKVNDFVEDVCWAQLQENICLHQQSLANNQEREEGDIIKLKISPLISYSAKFDDYPSYNLYDFDGMLSNAGLQHS